MKALLFRVVHSNLAIEVIERPRENANGTGCVREGSVLTLGGAFPPGPLIEVAYIDAWIHRFHD